MPKFSFAQFYECMEENDLLTRDKTTKDFLTHYVTTNPAAQNEKYTGVSVDSRNIERDQCFVPFSGKKYDGYKFAIQASCTSGGFVITDTVIPHLSLERQIVVSNKHRALHCMAEELRDKIEGKKIAYTGSAGKTTSKSMMHHILERIQKKAYKSPASFNTLLEGVPISLISCPNDVFAGLFEAGMSEAGEIELISQLIQPDIAVITSIQPAHIKQFKDLSDIAREKSKILERVEELAIIPDCPFHNIFTEILNSRSIPYYTFGKKNDDSSVKLDATLLNHTWNGKKSECKIDIKGEKFTMHLKHPGEASALSALANLCICHYLQLDLQKCIKALESFEPCMGRGRLVSVEILSKDMQIFDESYNANPEAMKNTIQTFNNMDFPHKVAIIGKMNELGDKAEEYYFALLEDLAKIRNVFLVGTDLAQLAKALREKAQENNVHLEDHEKHKVFFIDNQLELFSTLHQELPYYPTKTGFLIKGSRWGVQLEKTVDFLKNYHAQTKGS